VSHTQSHIKMLRNYCNTKLSQKVPKLYFLLRTLTSLALKMETDCFSENSASAYQSTLRHNTGQQYCHLRYCENARCLLCVDKQETVLMKLIT
jgi:hypothetical protein